MRAGVGAKSACVFCVYKVLLADAQSHIEENKILVNPYATEVSVNFVMGL